MTDQSTGELGFKLEGVPSFDYPTISMEGSILAHDILEHVNGLDSIGTIEDELLALGGVWFVRGQYEDIKRNHSMHSSLKHICSDIVNMGHIYCINESIRVGLGQSMAIGDYDIHETAMEIIDTARPMLIEELEGSEYTSARLEHYLNAAYHLMCQGWEKAEERFKGAELYANTIFWRIAEAIDDAIINSSYDFEIIEGAQIKLEWCFESGDVTASALTFYEIAGYKSYEEYEEAYN